MVLVMHAYVSLAKIACAMFAYDPCMCRPEENACKMLVFASLQAYPQDVIHDGTCKM
jgi:hypothetical protein